MICYTLTMTRKAVRTVVLSSTADFFNGMATAWAFASYDAIFRKAWIDLLTAVLLAILALALSIGIKIQLYDKHS
jgi:ABC-type Fe3+ transport system permease subunit